jgi:polyferredoxin
MSGQGVYLLLTASGVLLLSFRAPRGLRLPALVVAVGLLGFLRLELPSPHCIVEGLASTGRAGFLKPEMILKLAIVLLPTLVWGRIFCGWVCPKGALQEVLFVRRLRLRVPPRLDAVLRYLPYLSFVALVAFPLAWGYRLWGDLDPFLWAFQWHGHLPGLVLLLVTLPLSVVLLRPFCRYLCPLVPIFRLLSLRPPSRRTVDLAACTGCSSGRAACDYDAITTTRDPKRCVHHATECLQCGRCRSACPRGAVR